MSIINMLLPLLLFISGPGQAQLEGWNVLGPDHKHQHPLDFASIEWDYFMIHDFEGRFKGVVGYTLTNPRSKGGPLGKLLPVGGSVAVGGQFYDDQAIGNFVSFGVEGTKVNAANKNTYLTKPQQDVWASIEEGSEAKSVRLRGQTSEISWDFEVRQSQEELTENVFDSGPFSPKSDLKGVGRIPGEVWTVDALWPKTSVQGWVENRLTGERVEVEGKGYRENSWGRYLMPIDGWDFLVFSEDDSKGVNFVVQTYHHSKTLDFVDLGFYHDGRLKRLRFEADTLAYRHKTWTWDRRARQCVPQDWSIRGEKDGYLFQAKAVVDDRAQWSFLSNDAIGVREFFIQEQYPQVEGTIRDAATGKVIHSFQGQGGGEFAIRKGFFKVPDWLCRHWGRKFSHNRRQLP